MKIPLCTFCLRTGVLCPRCESLVRSGQVTERDMEVMKVLLDLENQFPQLRDSEYVRCVESDRVLVVLLRGLRGISRSLLMKLNKVLEDKLGKMVRVVDVATSFREGIEQLVMPLAVLGVNVVWFPDGTSETVIRVAREARRSIFSPRELESLISAVFGTKVRVVVEG
ncbi:MAG: transcription elongation factor NusA [Thermoprotei archaeon]|nr:MAG: transcription elongation factor NusA [Thermoprotei archaeon]